MFGFINIYKPKGKTSHDVVAILRRILKIKQIGHTGTLDPFAEGVLPICVGKATRLIEYLEDDKAYIGTIQFGKSTTTYDIEGDIVNSSEKVISKKELESVLHIFRGKISQTPPIYSAIKMNGKKLYEYARNGQEVEIKPREVEIFKLELIEFDAKKQEAKLLIECSKGTYIRSIANDIGAILGCYGHLSNLVRIKAGKFKLENSIKLDHIKSIEQIEELLINPLEYIEYSQYELNEIEKNKVSHGMGFDINKKDGYVLLIQNKTLCAVAEVQNKKVKILKVFI